MTRHSELAIPPVDRFYIRGQGHNPGSNFFEDTFRAPCWSHPGFVFDWPSNEHYYQAAKARHEEDARFIAAAPTPFKSKERGRDKNLELVDDWDGKRVPVMRAGLALKFTPGKEVTDWLLATGDALLIEGNDWDDQTFGCIRDENGEYTIGDNWLGFLLMAQRAILRGSVPGPVQTQLLADPSE